MKYSYVIFLLILVCSKDVKAKRIKNFHVVSYKMVSSDYQYSDDIIKWKGNYFTPYLYEEYRNGELSEVGIYKSDGILFFSYSELEKDSLLKETLSLSVQRDICVEKKMIIDRGTKYKVIYFKHRYYWHEGKNLKVYTLDNKAIRKD